MPTLRRSTLANPNWIEAKANNSMSENEHIQLILSAAKALEQEIKKLTITKDDGRSFYEVNRHLQDIKKHAIMRSANRRWDQDLSTSRLANS